MDQTDSAAADGLPESGTASGPSGQDTGPATDSRDGWVSIRNNALHVEDPRGSGKTAVICADDSVSVFVNDLPIHTPTDVRATTHIRIQLPLKAYPEYDCEFEVAPNLCALSLIVKQRVPGYFYQLPDTEPTLMLLIQAEAREAPLSAFAEDILPEILHELKARKITTGIHEERIKEAIGHPGTLVRIVETEPPVAPLNRLDYLFALPQPDPEHPAGFAIGFPLLKPCRAGEVLVRRVREDIGTKDICPRARNLVRRVREDISKPGVSIYGETLLPSKPEPMPLKAAPDRTAAVDLDENQATARLEGIPSFNGREVRVGPLDRRLGPLEGGPGAFYDIKGTLMVETSILNQAQIWVTQHVEIRGDVSHAHLEAQENLIVHGNTIKAQIIAGGDAAARMRLREPVEKLYAQLEQVLTYFREVRKAMPKARALDDKQIFLRVIKSQFPRLPEDVEAIWKLNQSLRQLHPRRTMVLKVVLANLMNLAERTMDERSFIDWLDKLRSFHDDLLQVDPLKTHVYLSYVQGSHVVSRGSIFILGEGCYNSELQAGEDILFCGKPGYCREGGLKAAGNLYVPELGSPNGSRLKVQLEPTSRIRSHKIHPGVELRFGENLHEHLLQVKTRVEVFVKNGKIVFKDLPD